MSLILLALALMLPSSAVQAQAPERPSRCPSVSVLQGLTDRAVHAGSAFLLHLPPLAFQGPIQHYQVSLADDVGSLPRWLVYSAQTGTLQGLALREESGEYVLRVTAVGQCNMVAPTVSSTFHLRVLSGTSAGAEALPLESMLAREKSGSSLGCPVGEMATMAGLQFHADLGSLVAMERLRLVTTMADYLHIPSASVTLLSYRDELTLQRENTTILASGHTTSLAPVSDGEGLYGWGSRAEILWTVSCGEFEILPDLVQILQYSTNSGRLSILLGKPVGGWRVLSHGRLTKARRPRQLCQTPTPTQMIVPPKQVMETALRPPFVGLLTTTWQVPMLTQSPETVAASKKRPSLTDFQKTVKGHTEEFSLTSGKTLSHTIDLLTAISSESWPDIIGPDGDFPITLHHSLPLLHTTDYLAKDSKTSATDPSYVISKTWPMNVLVDSSTSATMSSLASKVTVESSQRTASVIFFPILPAHTTPYRSSIKDQQTLTRYQATQSYPEESMLTSRNIFYSTMTVNPLVVPRTKAPDSIIFSMADLEQHTQRSQEVWESTTTKFTKTQEIFDTKSEISQQFSHFRPLPLPTSAVTVDQKLRWSKHKETSLPRVFNGQTTKLYSTNLELLTTLDIEPSASFLNSREALRSLTTLSLSTLALSAKETSVSDRIFPTVLMYSLSISSIGLLSTLTAGPPLMNTVYDMSPQRTTSFAGSSVMFMWSVITPTLETEQSEHSINMTEMGPSARLSLNVQHTTSGSPTDTISSHSSLFLKSPGQSDFGDYMTAFVQIGQPGTTTSQTTLEVLSSQFELETYSLESFVTSSPELELPMSVTSHSLLDIYLDSSSWFDLQASMTSLSQPGIQTFMTTASQFQQKTSMNLQSELGNTKISAPFMLESSFASYSQLRQGTSVTNLVTGSTRQVAMTPAWSDNTITETTLLSTLHYSPVTSSHMTGNMITETVSATIPGKTNRETALLDYFSTITSSQVLSKASDLNFLSPATLFISPTTPYTGQIDTMLPLGSVQISTQVTALRDVTVVMSIHPLQSLDVHPLSIAQPQSSGEWVISSALTLQTEPTALPSRGEDSYTWPHSSEVTLKTYHSTRKPDMPHIILQAPYSTTPPSPQQDTADLMLSSLRGDTHPLWPTYSEEATAMEGSSKYSSLGDGQHTVLVALMETPLLTTSIFMPYPLFTRSHLTTPQIWLPTAVMNTEDLKTFTGEFSNQLTIRSHSVDPSYSLIETTKDEGSVTSAIAWFSPVDTMGDNIQSFISETVTLLSDISHLIDVPLHSEGVITDAMATGQPVTPSSALQNIVPSRPPRLSISQSLNNLLTLDLKPTMATTELGTPPNLTVLPSLLLTSLQTEDILSTTLLSSKPHEKESTAVIPATHLQKGDRSEYTSIVSLSPLPALAFTQTMTHSETPVIVHQHHTLCLSLFVPVSVVTPSESLGPGDFDGTSVSAQTNGLTITLESSKRQSIAQTASSSTISTGPSNHPPMVLQSIPPLEATVGIPFHFSIPTRTFLDPEDGEANKLTLEISPLDGSPFGPASWIRLDQRLQLLHGVPLESDLQFSPQQLLLLAQDSGGLTAQLPLVFEVHRTSQEPCHIYVLTTRNSLHSFLRERHRIELFLKKLAYFFNDSNANHLALLSLSAGSAVVAWYNFTLCQPGRRTKGWCPEHQIQSMLARMRTEDGHVDPSFVQAMLPEFLITKVGELTLGGVCLPGTSTATLPAPATTITTPQSEIYPWTARLLIALLIICGLFLLAVLLIAVLRSCRRYGTLSLHPSEVYPNRPLERRALKPRLPPLFEEELPPPPPQLWFNLTPLPQEEPLTTAPTHNNHPHTRPQQTSVPLQPPPRYQLPPPYSTDSHKYKGTQHETPNSKCGI